MDAPQKTEGQKSSQSNPTPPGSTANASQSASSKGQNGPDQKQSTIPKAPSLSLPKGGGAIHGMGEKHDVAASTGESKSSIPIHVSASRGNFQPQLSLQYTSGSGNGPFGLGWSLEIPNITRKTEKGLPRYFDSGPESDADVFLLAGVEDLVPVFQRDAQGNIVLQSEGTPLIKDVTLGNYKVRTYQPRIEGTFSRIERWMNITEQGDIYWKVITGNNVTSIYGKDDNSRVFNPVMTPGQAKCIFSWLLSESFDAHGNAMVFTYKAEDSSNVDAAQPHEVNRSSLSRTAHRYIKTIHYGNQTPNRDMNTWNPTSAANLPATTWVFTVVFDYGEHDLNNPTPVESTIWPCRQDPFSTYKPGFEDRTYRLCRRILMFHQFAELGSSPRLVTSTDILYDENPVATKLTQCTSAGYSPSGNAAMPYIRSTLPPLQYEYSEFPPDAELANRIAQDVDPSFLENVPAGVDGSNYQWLDLYSEGLPGVFSEQQGGWFFKRNSSANNFVKPSTSTTNTHEPALVEPRFEPLTLISSLPSVSVTGGDAQFGDVDGGGHLDVINLQPGCWGFFEKTDQDGWTEFRSFHSYPNIPSKDTKLVDLTGDGLADLLIAGDQLYTWCQSLGDWGYGEPHTVIQTNDESYGPVSLFSDTEEYIVLADFSGDGLSDIVRIRNGDIVYWPNLGYGRFGPMIRMDNAPWFEPVDLFETKRVHLADIDGSGTTDMLYVHSAGVDIYLNCSGNGFTDVKRISAFPENYTLSTVSTVDLLGNGTSCLVWSTQTPQNGNVLRYLDIVGNVKPHLLTKSINNLGMETTIHYAPSTKFYLQDRQEGRPWITRLPFPVYCVEKVELLDRISGNRYVNKYRYHDGFYDGLEREFRGFAMVERWDTDNYAEMSQKNSTNVDSSWHVPPAHSKTWYHTGVYIDSAKITTRWAHEYFGLTTGIDHNLLDDTILPTTPLLGGNELREACRALKGHVLRVETYADDGTSSAQIPYSFQETNYTIEAIQPLQDANLHSIYMVHSRESIDYSCERQPQDPRINHNMTLQVDQYGNPLKSIKIAYGRTPGMSQLTGTDVEKQETTLFLYTANDMTNLVNSSDNYRLPITYETRTYELSGLQPAVGKQFTLSDFVSTDFAPITSLTLIPFEQTNNPSTKQMRLVTQSRTLYRAEDLTALLPAGQVGATAIPGCEYQHCFTPGLISKVFQRQLPGQSLQSLLPTPGTVLVGTGEQQAGYVDVDGDGNYWNPSGRVFYHIDPTASAATELSQARSNFFAPRRYTDPFGNNALVTYDGYNLYPIETQDALGNAITVEMDYRVLSPSLVTDPNGNRSAVAFDALGYVVGTALMGKASENQGDSLAGFQTDLTQAQMDEYFANPRAAGSIAASLLGSATSRMIYDPHRYWVNEPNVLPAYTSVIARETHASDPSPGQATKLQLSFEYTDGFGRVIQSKSQDKAGPITDGGAVVSNRWIGSGWTLFNNKAQPVRTYEPFFDDTHEYKYFINGVSTISFYDPLGRVIGTLQPDHSITKVNFNPWMQTTFDGNDNILMPNPKTDPDIGPYLAPLPDYESTPTWYSQRINGGLGTAQQSAAQKTAAHANTPTIAHLDVLGRTILTYRDNGGGVLLPSRTTIDIIGNQREVFDASNRLTMSFDFDMMSTRIHQSSPDSGDRWLLSDVGGRPLFTWNSRGFRQRSVYDVARRLVQNYSRNDSVAGSPEALVGQYLFGEGVPNAAASNLKARVYQVSDQGGTATTPLYDFKGNLLTSERTFAQNYKTLIDWSQPVALESETFVSRTTYDALNRVVTATTPENSVGYRIYNESGRLEQIWMNTRGEQTSSDPTTWTPIVTSSDYNARHQVTQVTHGNGVQTLRTYDPVTFRLLRIQTLLPGATGQTMLQDLNYVYDPVGNVTSIKDNAQQTTYFRNTIVDPSSDYTYDPVYRLINATGREHLGQNSQPNVPSYSDQSNVGLPQPGDGNAMARYTESYTYDVNDNMTKLSHAGSDATKPGWTRNLTYDASSNRVLSSSVGSTSENYTYDVHGNMTSLPPLSAIAWNFLDQLQSTTQQVVNNGTPETTYYVYDITGQRIRKITERSAGQGETPTKLKERLYIGASEYWRTYAGDGVTLNLERQTLSINGEGGRVALIETRTVGTDPSVPQQIRFQFGNYIGSAVLELGQDGSIISYEEYTPYGSTSYQAVASQLNAPKRYRYSGKERDEESGLYYHGARYYAPWLRRWISTDPIGIRDGLNLYEYVASNPIKLSDPTGHAGASDPPPPTNDATLSKSESILVRRLEGIIASENLAQLLRSKGLEVGEEVVAKAGLRGSRLDAIQKYKSFESKLIDISKYRDKVTGALDEGKIKSLLKDKYFKQVAKHEAAIKEAIALAKSGDLKKAEAFKGFMNVEKEVLVFTVKNLKGGEAGLQELREFQKLTRSLSGATGPAIGAISETNALLQKAAKISNEGSKAYKALQVVKGAGEALHVLAPAAKALGKLGPVGTAVSVLQDSATLLSSTAKTDDKIHAGLDLLSNGLLESGNPVAEAAGAGIAVGNALEEHLHVSDYSAAAGMKANEWLKEHGASGDQALVGGAIATVVSTPFAIGAAAIDKVGSWFK